MKSAYQKYKTTSVQSASREKLLLMLYEAAIRFIKKALKAIDEKDIAERGLNIGKAYDIFMELNNTLDHKSGGEIALNLEQLYMFLTDQLTQANIKGDRKPLEDALKITETLYSGWVEAIESLKKQEEAK
ncbi:MAG: flagellar export chaperone FliS [Bdellovibrionaceae bacterium]|nr:flagellar export chaperone FliS [Pseudobdellovibrionaceae bacterium]|tara:strand:- start:5445 stop:5834 length:390 start_codon:yes stop_codon:yes gene_type:complete